MGSCFRPKIATAKRFSRFRSTLPLQLPCSKPNNIHKPIFFKYHDAIAVFEGMLIEDPTPPTHEFNHLLSSIAKTFPKTNGVVVDSYTEMLKMGISLDLVSYNILMKCYADAKLMGYSLSLFGKVFKLGFQSTGFTLNTLLKPLFSSGKVVEAIQFYNSSDFYGISSLSDQYWDIGEGSLRPRKCSNCIDVCYGKLLSSYIYVESNF
ncbi:hypothetical protein MTR_1g054690 [Medicago truncatula]|uniref:Uncharacterized protein n=1 Tax=Medicago truncatula TaxID=3880 RepID=A0A072VIC1_MEDTR|nr:hypothetical protein MTR_1g054690 [Medicago truncatula]